MTTESPRIVTPEHAAALRRNVFDEPWTDCGHPDWGHGWGWGIQNSAGGYVVKPGDPHRQQGIGGSDARLMAAAPDLAHTVATEPKRIEEAARAAVVKALRKLATKAGDNDTYFDALHMAAAIENGEPL